MKRLDYCCFMWYIYIIKSEMHRIAQGGNSMKHKINYLGFLSLLALIAILGLITDNNGLYGFLDLPIILGIFGSFQTNSSNLMFKRLQHLLLCLK